MDGQRRQTKGLGWTVVYRQLKGTSRHTERETGRQRKEQVDRVINGQTYIYMNRQLEGQTCEETDRQMKVKANGGMDRLRDRQMKEWTNQKTD